MKTFAWICLVLGGLSFIGAILTENNPTGPTFWLGIGIFLMYRANQNQKNKEEKEKWNKNE